MSPVQLDTSQAATDTIATYVNGMDTSPVQLDTSEAATDQSASSIGFGDR
jgi:hypothetical protein